MSFAATQRCPRCPALTAELEELRAHRDAPRFMVVGSQQHVRIADDKVVHMLVYAIDGSTMGPKYDAAVLLARLDAAERVAEACRRLLERGYMATRDARDALAVYDALPGAR